MSRAGPHVRHCCYRVPVSAAGLPPDDRLAPVDDAAVRAGRDRRTVFRWIQAGWLTPYKKRGDKRTQVDLAELPEAMRKAGRPGPKPRRERESG